MMMKIVYIILFVSTLFNSCIENDVPFPVVLINIESISGVGFTTKSIDATNRIATLSLEETTDISRVNIENIEITEKGKTPYALSGLFDLRTPMYITLSLYADYDWEIRAEQIIEREFLFEGQIGEGEFDYENKTIKAYVSKDTALNNIEVKKLKLGPHDITTMTPSIDKLVNFEAPVSVDVKYHNVSETWTLSIEQTDIKVQFTKNDVWTKIAWLEAIGNGSNVGFIYRKEDVQEWDTIPKEQVTVDGGSFSTKITGLLPEVKYEFIAYVDDNVTAIYSATTDPELQLVNGGFEDWMKPGKPYYPYKDENSKFWNSGNPGATTLSADDNTTIPIDDIRPGSTGEKSVQLSSKFIVAKFAGGSLFVGNYVGTRGTNGIIGLGQPFTLRPTAFRVWVKYKGGKINRGTEGPLGVSIIPGETDDACTIYAALGTWTPEKYGITAAANEANPMLGTVQTPIIVDTRDKSTFFNSDTPDVIAYGVYTTSESFDEWRQITIPLDYRTTSVVPTHIVIVCASSIYADYFTGCDNSVMCMDDFELIYE